MNELPGLRPRIEYPPAPHATDEELAEEIAMATAWLRCPEAWLRHRIRGRWVPFDRKHHAQPRNSMRMTHRPSCEGPWFWCMCPTPRGYTIGQAIRHRERVTRIHSAYRLRSKRRRGER
jgi:hypothetical protein